MPRRFDARRPGFEAELRQFLAETRAAASEVDGAVAEILEKVRRHGDHALIEFARRFDRVELSLETLRVTPEEVRAAKAACPPETLAALRFARDRIEDYHRRQLPADGAWTDGSGVRLGWRWWPVEAVGIYVPGGTAAYPSTVLMNAVPAKVAGVPRVAMATPATGGVIAPLVLAAAEVAGVDEVYRIGGAQAIAALAFGTATVAPVAKIVGPGNAYVAAAKRQVFGAVGIDMIAGPSEILVVADGDADPAWIAADLLSQAEHDTAAQAILVTDDEAFAESVAAAIVQQLRTLPRAAIAEESWERHGAIILVGSLADAPAIVDRVAPEHLELAVAEPEGLAARIRNAGAIFLGHHAPEAVGDYVAGPSHVLPTSGSARFASGLGVLDFLKRSSLIGLDLEALHALGPAARRLAEAEGLDAHALSLALRLPPEKG